MIAWFLVDGSGLGSALLDTAGDTDEVFEQRWAYLLYQYAPIHFTARTCAFIVKAVILVRSMALPEMTTFLQMLSKASE